MNKANERSDLARRRFLLPFTPVRAFFLPDSRQTFRTTLVQNRSETTSGDQEQEHEHEKDQDQEKEKEQEQQQKEQEKEKEQEEEEERRSPPCRTERCRGCASSC